MIVNSFTFRSFAVVLLLAAPLAMAEGQNQTNLSVSAATQLLTQLDQLQSQVRTLTGKLEDQQHQIDQMKSQQRDRYVDLDQRVSMLMAKLAQQQAPAAPAATPGSVPTAAPSAMPAATPSNAPSTSKTDNEPTNISDMGAQANGASASDVKLAPIALKPVTPEARQAYNNAYQLIRERQFETAEVSFTEFVKDFPDNQLTGNGHYWLGELKLVLGKPKEAINQFNIVIKKFPGHNKVPDALYKLGIVNDQLGNTDKSKSYLQEVIRRFPDSKAAKLSKSYLTKLN
ncbi:Outer membrane protein assembly factor BamD [Marinomonas spartinae]|uniref:Cell division coordinator CpoB n=1 Tax=Marinomonas spartinae TaxID=1792290 RepID=A0A1A8TN49_9GAMM|nr:Outer membrane protein assembly factor BamD [Marinomonas spartinae]